MVFIESSCLFWGCTRLPSVDLQISAKACALLYALMVDISDPMQAITLRMMRRSPATEGQMHLFGPGGVGDGGGQGGVWQSYLFV